MSQEAHVIDTKSNLILCSKHYNMLDRKQHKEQERQE